MVTELHITGASLTVLPGVASSRSAKNAPPTVYPDREKGFRARMPEVDDTDKLNRNVLRSWMRLYLNYLWSECSTTRRSWTADRLRNMSEWMGGKGPVPWGKITKDSLDWFIDRSRLPAEWDDLSDPHTWTRPQLLRFYLHIVAGQSGELASGSVFQFLHTVAVLDTSAPEFKELCTERPTQCQLSWSPDEKLYAILLEREAMGHQTPASWSGLPLARTQGVYEGFDASSRQSMRDLSTPLVKIAALVTLLSELERKGPVHVSRQALLPA